MTTQRDQEEQDLRIDQMTINIEKLRLDIEQSTKRWQHDQEVQRRHDNWEARKFLLACVVAGVTVLGGLITILHLGSNDRPTFPPGTIITIPPAKP